MTISAVVRNGSVIRGGRQEPAHEIPVPGITADSRAGVLEWLELKPVERKAHVLSIGIESKPIGRDQVSHPCPFPHVAVEPEPAIHGVDHAGPA